MEDWRYSSTFLTAALDGQGSFKSWTLYVEDSRLYELSRRLGESLGRSGRFTENPYDCPNGLASREQDLTKDVPLRQNTVALCKSAPERCATYTAAHPAVAVGRSTASAHTATAYRGQV